MLHYIQKLKELHNGQITTLHYPITKALTPAHKQSEVFNQSNAAMSKE